MAVNVPNPGLFFAQIGQAITSLRNDYQTVLNLNAYITAMGGATFLEAAPFSLSSGDASAVVAALGNLAGSNLGTALTNSETLWGGL